MGGLPGLFGTGYGQVALVKLGLFVVLLALAALNRLALTDRLAGTASDAPRHHMRISFRQFVEDCYRENARRMDAFDPDLLQPRLLTAIPNMAVAGLRLWEWRRPHRQRHTAEG
jgi:hypothetical protein